MAQQIQIDILIQKAQASQSLTDFKKNLRELQLALSQATDPAEVLKLQKAIAATTKASEDFRDRLQTIKLDTFEQGAKIGQLVAGGFAAATSAAALFGAESENVNKALLKVQASIGLLQGLQSLKELPRVFGDLRSAIGLTNVSLTTTKGLLASLGIGLLIAAVGVLVANFDKLKDFFNETFPAVSEFFSTLVPRLVAVGRTIADFFRGNFDVAKNFEENYTEVVRENEAERQKIREAERKRFAESEAKVEKERRDAQLNNIRLVARERLLEANKRRASELELSRITLNNLREELAAVRRLGGSREEQLALLEKITAEENKQADLKKNQAKENEQEAIKNLEKINDLVDKAGQQRLDDLNKFIKGIQEENKAIEERYQREEIEVNKSANKKIRLLEFETAARLKNGEKLEDVEKDRSNALEKIELERSVALTDISINRANELLKVYENNQNRINLSIGKTATNFQTDVQSAYEKQLKLLKDDGKITQEEFDKTFNQFKKLVSDTLNKLGLLNDENNKDFVESYNEQTVVLDNSLTKRFQLIVEFFRRSKKEEEEATEKTKQEAQKKLANIQEILQISNQIFGDLGNIFNSNLDMQLNELVASIDKRTQEIQSFYDEQLNRQDLTERKRVSIEKKRDEELTALDEQRRAKEKEINDRRAGGQLAADLASTSFIVAQQIAAALLTNPAVIPFIIGAGAAASAAAIARFNAERSRQFKDGGLLVGKSHSEGGIKGTGAFSNIEVEGGEFITNRKATANFLPLLESINANGGSGNSSEFMNELRNIRGELSMIRENPFKAYVIESELTSVQNRVSQLERKVRIS